MTVVVAGGRPGVVIETAMDPIPAAGGGSPSETETKSPLAKRTAATWYVRPPAWTVRTAYGGCAAGAGAATAAASGAEAAAAETLV